MADDLDHLFITGFTTSRTFASSWRVIPPAPPRRDRGAHGGKLLSQIDRLILRERRLRVARLSEDLPIDAGSSITLQVAPGTLDPSGFEWKAAGIKVLSVTADKRFEYVTLFVPRGNLSALKERIEEYLNEMTRFSKPKNAKLITAIESIGPAAFRYMWTDDPDAIPDDDSERLFQLWLRVTEGGPLETLSYFRRAAQKFQIKTVPGYVRFPGRIVIAAKTRRSVLERAIKLLDLIAEIRETRPTADFFIEQLQPQDRAAFIADLARRLQPPDRDFDDVYITLLDTGVNKHPLLDRLITDGDKHTVRGEWGTSDRVGHGTEMAGIASFGNLADALAHAEIVPIAAFLESVKILNRNAHTPPHLYGWVTEQAADLVESVDAERRRTFSMAITESGKTLGFPSDWSAVVDRLAFGLPTAASAGDASDDSLRPVRPKLFVISAGNIDQGLWSDYPNINTLEGIQSPGQSWNALTVGAATRLTAYDETQSPGLRRLANSGELSPSSRTSRTWHRQWPLKPDVVAEGGNGCVESRNHENVIVGPGSLRLLTTSRDALLQPLTETGDTSAASADVSRLAAWIASRYPNYWPETIRALIVHGAKWTQRMSTVLGNDPGAEEKYTLLRTYGFGMIDYERTLRSASDRATLVLQRTTVPYLWDEEGKRVALGNMHLHGLPWPRQALEALGGAAVRLHLTLSYFVEPNPSQRGWRSKFRYQSHALRFAVQGSTEAESEFAARVNAADRDGDDDDLSMNDPDRDGWVIGSQVRNRGCIHRDIWEGTAVELATKSHIAVFPVGGWWKDAGRHSIEVRYSLVVSIEAIGEIDVNLYTPIEVAVAADITVRG